MTNKRTRDIGTYDPETDGHFFYRLGQAIILASVGAVVWFIHSYVGWWNFLLALIGLVVLGMLVAPRYFKYLPEFHFTSLDHRPHHGDVCAYEYCLSEEEMAEIDELEAILGPVHAEATVSDPTERAEVVVWWGIFLSFPGFFIIGWLEDGTWVTITHLLLSATLAAAGLWWTLTVLGLTKKS
jgi:hypothetical protein